MECSAYLEIAGYSGSQFFLGENFFGTPKLVESFHGSGGFFRVTRTALGFYFRNQTLGVKLVTLHLNSQFRSRLEQARNLG